MSVTAISNLPPVVLVVEDDKTALDLRVEALSEAGCTPIPARSHAEALRALDEGPAVDLVLTDVNLNAHHDDRSGVTLARHVKRHLPGVPVVGYSAWFREDALADAMDTFDVFWTKGDLDYRAFPAKIEVCRELALAHREPAPKADIGAAVERLQEQVDWQGVAIRWIQERMLTAEQLEWKIVVVLGVLMGLLTAAVGLVVALSALFS